MLIVFYILKRILSGLNDCIVTRIQLATSSDSQEKRSLQRLKRHFSESLSGTLFAAFEYVVRMDKISYPSILSSTLAIAFHVRLTFLFFSSQSRNIYDPIFITVLLFYSIFSIASFTLSHRLLLPFHLDYCMLFFTFSYFSFFIRGSYQPFLNS